MEHPLPTSILKDNNSHIEPPDYRHFSHIDQISSDSQFSHNIKFPIDPPKEIINNTITPKSNIPQKITTSKKLRYVQDKQLLNFFNKRRLVLDTPFSTRSTISYGLIVYARDTKRWAIIQRKHSVEFILFIRGLYGLTHLPLLLKCITSNEANIITKCITEGTEFFRNIYLNDLNLDPSGLEYALIRMAESHKIVINLLNKLDLSSNELKWTWPKGRLHISSDRETPFSCAQREFTEEVELELPTALFISDTYISENIRTISGRNIESRYWIYIIPHEVPMSHPQSHPEVSNRQWVDTDMCEKTLQHNILFKYVVTIVSKFMNHQS